MKPACNPKPNSKADGASQGRYLPPLLLNGHNHFFLIFYMYLFLRETEHKWGRGRDRRRQIFFFLNFFLMFYFWGRERQEHEWGRGRERGRHRIRKQAPGSEWSAQSPMWDSNSQTVRSWPEPKWVAQPTEPSRRPKETQNLKQTPGSELSAQSPTQGSNSQTSRLWLDA